MSEKKTKTKTGGEPRLTIDNLGKDALDVLFRGNGSLVCDILKKLSSCRIVQNNAQLQRGLDNFTEAHDVGVFNGLK